MRNFADGKQREVGVENSGHAQGFSDGIGRDIPLRDGKYRLVAHRSNSLTDANPARPASHDRSIFWEIRVEASSGDYVGSRRAVPLRHKH